MNLKLDLPCSLRAFRSSRKPVASVEREGGDYGSGLIRGAAVITRGEALGHDMWIDAVMLAQVEDAVNANPKGSKSRFAHPGMSGDGLGKALGRFKDGRTDGDIVRADLHLYDTAHKTPDGDLAEYIMGLAVEDAEAFGTSISFEPDFGEEDRFYAENEDKDGQFHSPDPLNEKNLPHARLAYLEAVDIVDSPAANPGGLFHRGHEFILEADALFEYTLGLREQFDELGNIGLGVAPERLRDYVARFMQGRGLYIARRPVPAIAIARASIETDSD